MAGPKLRIEAPTRTDRMNGLSDVAEFILDNNFGAAEDVVFVSDGCAFPQLEADRCYVADVPDKQFDGIFLNNAITDIFTIYAGSQCFANPEPDFEERAVRTLEKGRDRVLEGQLVPWASAAAELQFGGTPVGALAEVEQALDKGYIGQGLIIMSRSDAIRAAAAGALVRAADGTLRTILNTPVLATSAFDQGMVYGVGAVTVRYTGTTVTDLITPRQNEHQALAEAKFVIAVDCEFRVKSSTSTIA